jgi:predicted transcriptional regulator
MQALGQHGALSTGDLTAKGRGGSKYAVRTLMDQLAEKGLVHSTGNRRSQRWHLGAKGSSPKEAESRGAR